jgi:hypothetical protein
MFWKSYEKNQVIENLRLTNSSRRELVVKREPNAPTPWGVGVHVRASRLVSMVSDCVYAQQQPIVRRRILGDTLKVLKSSYGRIHGILPWPMPGRPRNGRRWKPVIKKL